MTCGDQVLAEEGNPDSSLHREFTDYLGHLAVAAHSAGNHLEAAEKLQWAAREKAKLH